MSISAKIKILVTDLPVKVRHHAARAFTGCVSLHVTHDMNWRMFLTWKHFPDTLVCRAMAKRMAKYATNHYTAISVPPVSKKTMDENAHCTAFLAEELSNILGVPFVRFFQKRQVTKSHHRYQSLVQEKPILIQEAVGKFRGGCVLMIDDVITTGMTVFLCYEALVKEGIHVDGLIWCHTTRIKK